MFSPTDLLGERYRLVERIATGGMGVVWRAVDTVLDRHVAIKLIRPEYADDPTFRDRLRSEARAIAAIRSPHVVRIFDIGEEPDQSGRVRSYLVMELVDGVPLSQRLRGSTPLAPPTVAAIVRQAASALAAAHARGIVHRDVKPANLLLDAADRLTVVDFGIARAADAVSLTATNTMLGTAHYLSPEQVAGQSATACSDVYALGVVAYRCLAGRLPFDGDGDIAVALAHREQPVPELPDGVPEGFAALVRQMLSKAPGGRPSAADIVTRASQLAEDRAPMVDPAAGAPAMAGPDSTATAQLMATDVTGRAADRPARRRPVALAAAGGATALAVALAFLVGGSGGGGIDDAPAAPPVSVPSTSSSPSASATSSASARTSAGTPRSSGGHRILTRQVAPPSHEPAPPAKPKPKSKPEGKPKSKSKPKPPAPKQQSKPPPKPKAKPPGPKPPAPKQKPHVR